MGLNSAVSGGGAPIQNTAPTSPEWVIDPKTGEYVNKSTGQTWSAYQTELGNGYERRQQSGGAGADPFSSTLGNFVEPEKALAIPFNPGRAVAPVTRYLGGKAEPTADKVLPKVGLGPPPGTNGPAVAGGAAWKGPVGTAPNDPNGAAGSATGNGTLASDLNAARALRGTIDSTYPGARPAPQVTGGTPVRAPLINAATTGAPQQVSTAPVNARQALGAAPVQTQNVAAPAPVTAQTVQAQQAATTLAGPAALGTAQQGVASTATGATINVDPSNEVRADQRSLVGNLQGVIAGTAPSVAAEQYRQSLADIADRGAASVAGATGSQRGAMKRAALYATADATSRSARDLALIRAQESATGRAQLGGVLDSTRGQDVGLATKQADLTQDVSKTNAGLETTTSNSNAELGTRTSLANAGAVNDVNKFNAGQTTDTSRFNAGQGNTVALGNAGNKLSADTGNVTRATDVATGNANRGVTVATGNADRSQALNTFNTGQGNAVDMSNQSAQIGVDTGNANRNLSGEQFNVGQTNDIAKLGAQQTLDAGKFNSGQELQTQIANVDAILKSRGMDDQARADYIKNLLAQSGQVLNADVAKAGIDQISKANSDAFLGGIIKTVGTAAMVA